MDIKEWNPARRAMGRAASVILALVLGSAWGGSPVHTGNEVLLAQAKAAKCVRLGKSGGRETLTNRCEECRIVKLQRRRPGGDFPAVRTVTVPDLARIELSFRGPGRTRIVSDQSCQAAAQTQKDDGQRCIQVKAMRNGTLALINQCAVCRMAVVQLSVRGGGRKMQTMAVAARSAVPVGGAGQARVLTEKSCR
jgi:hypothetical protein